MRHVNHLGKNICCYNHNERFTRLISPVHVAHLHTAFRMVCMKCISRGLHPFDVPYGGQLDAEVNEFTDLVGVAESLSPGLAEQLRDAVPFVLENVLYYNFCAFSHMNGRKCGGQCGGERTAKAIKLLEKKGRLTKVELVEIVKAAYCDRGAHENPATEVANQEVEAEMRDLLDELRTLELGPRWIFVIFQMFLYLCGRCVDPSSVRSREARLDQWVQNHLATGHAVNLNLQINHLEMP